MRRWATNALEATREVYCRLAEPCNGVCPYNYWLRLPLKVLRGRVRLLSSTLAGHAALQTASVSRSTKKEGQTASRSGAIVAYGVEEGEELVGAVRDACALLESVLGSASAQGATEAA